MPLHVGLDSSSYVGYTYLDLAISYPCSSLCYGAVLKTEIILLLRISVNTY